MRTRNITVSDDYVPTLNLGRQGENAVSQVVFDVSSLITDYGAGTGTVVVQRPGETTTYQHDDTVQSGDTVTWTVSSADTELAGTGMVQLFWIVDNAITKTITYQSYIEPALMNPTDAPVSPSGWISEEIGNLDNLNTTDKSNLVGAVNEVVANLDEYEQIFTADVGESVSNWLDQHPEATTTVEDGSLSDVKFTETERKRKMSFYNTLAEMMSDSSLIVGKWVHVFGECYPEYDGKDLDFVITNVSNYYAILLDNGLYAEPYVPYAHPETYPPEVAYNILKCGLTYFDRSNLVYTPEGHSYESIFADEVAVYQDDTMSIDCSTFAQACLMGVEYENSRFFNDINIPQPWGYKFPRGLPVSQLQSTRTQGFTASELAFYAYLHGWLYEISPDGGNVAVGDFVFDSYEITRENEFREIGHVQIVFGKISQLDEGIRCIEVGSGVTGVNKYGNNICHIRAYRSGIDTAIKYGARFPIQASASSKNITSIRRRNLEYPYTLTGSPVGVTGIVYTTENIKAGEAYTAVVKGNLSALVDGWYPFLRLTSVTGTMIYNTMSYAASIDGATNTMYMTFTPLRDTNTASIYNAIQIGINNISGSGSLSVVIDDIQIYKGLFFGDNEKTDVDVTLNSGITVNTKVIDGTKARFDLIVPISGSTYTGISLGTVDLYNFDSRMIPVNVVSGTTSSGAVTSHTGISANLHYAQNNLTLNVFADVENLSSVRIRFDIDFGS